MEMHLPLDRSVRTPAGMWILGSLGALVAIASAMLLVYSLATTWGYAGRLDMVIQFLLLVETAIGLLIAVRAWRRLQN